MCVCPSSFPFGIDGGMWDVIVLIPDRCLSIYFDQDNRNKLSLDLKNGFSRHGSFCAEDVLKC